LGGFLLFLRNDAADNLLARFEGLALAGVLRLGVQGLPELVEGLAGDG